MSNVTKRVLSLMLVLAMVLSFVPGFAQTAHAAEDDTEIVADAAVEPVAEETEETTEATEPEAEEEPVVEETTEATEPEAEEEILTVEEIVVSDAAALAGSLTLSVNGLGAEWTDATGKGKADWSADGTTITGELQVPTRDSNTTVLTLTNNKSEQAVLSFNWQGTTPNPYATITVNGEAITGTSTITEPSGKVETILDAGDSVKVELSASRGKSAFDITIQITDLNLYVDSKVTTTFKAIDAAVGSYEVNGESITKDTVIEQNAKNSYKLKAAPAEGYVFSGWYSETTQSFIATSIEAEVNLSENQTIYPMFIAKDDAVWGVGEAFFTEWEEASSAAYKGTDKIVVLLKDYTLTEDITVPAGVTLLVPFDEKNTCYYEAPANTGLDYGDDQYVDGPNPWQKPYAYRTLTLGQNVTITVNGSMSVSAKHSSGNGSGQATAGSPSGPCGFVKTGSGSEIVVNNKGALYAWGYVVGSGAVTANSGAAVYENIQFSDFRGGSASSAFMNAFEVFPFNQYFVQNIELPVTLYKGAKEVVYTSIYAANTANATPIDFIGTDQSMFRMEDGAYIVKNYNGDDDRMEVSVFGDVSLNGLSVTLMDMTLDSSMFVLPITNNITVNVEEGLTTINQNVALLPGAELNIAEAGGVYLAEGWSVFVYDADEWTSGYLLTKLADDATGDIADQSGKQYSISDTRTNCKFVHIDANLRPVAYSYANGTNVVRNNNSLVDAKVVVDGLLELDGYLYTTEGGANITAKGEGQIVMWVGNGEQPYTFQATQSGTNVTWAALPLTAPQLKNADGSYTSTSDVDPSYGAAFTYVDGKWSDTVTVTFDANGATGEMEAIVVSNIDLFLDTVEVEVPANGFTMNNGTFVEWNTKADGTGNSYKPNDSLTVTEDVTLYAIWEVTVPKYTVTWVNEAGETVDSETVEHGKDATKNPAVPEKTGYTGEWDATATNVTGDVTIKPVYTINKYTVTWVNEAGETVESETVEYGKDATKTPTVPEKTGYTGVWEKTATNVTTDVTIKPVYTINKYTVTWVKEDGETVVDTETVEYGKDATKTPTVPEKTGYTGVWEKEATNVTGDMTIKPVYTINKYTVTWVKEDGETVVDTETVEYGKDATKTPAVPEKTGYTGKWDKVATNVKSDVTVTAVYTVNKYTLTLAMAEEDADTYYTNTFEYGATIPAIENPERKGYAFEGWSADIPETMPANDVFIYANWSDPIDYTVTWTINGEYYDQDSYHYGGNIWIPEYQIPEGYEFSGWTGVPATMPDQNLTFDATLTAKTYTITWKLGGKEYTTTVQHGKPISEPEIQVPENYYGYRWTTEIPDTATEGMTIDGVWTVSVNVLGLEDEKLQFSSGGLTWDPTTKVVDVGDSAYLNYRGTNYKEGCTLYLVNTADKTEKHEITYASGATVYPSVTITENTTFQLTAVPNTYKVTFTVNGEAYGEPVDVEFGNAITAPAYTVPEGHTFSGWTLPETMPAEDITLNATLEVNKYTLVINSMQFDGEGHAYTPIEVDVPYGAKLADYIPDDVYQPGDEVAVNGNKYKGTWKIIGWETRSAEGDSQDINIANDTMPVDGITIIQKFTFTGWRTDDKGSKYYIDFMRNQYYKDTVAHIDGEAYLFDEDGYIVAGAGLVRFVTEDGTVEYYYFCDGYCEESDEACSFREPSYTAFKDGVHWLYNNNDLLPKWDYEFDERGVILHHEDTSLNGLVDEGKDTIYYIDGVPAYMGLIEIDGDLYYVRSSGKLIKNKTYWISKTNDLMKEGSYEFDADGKLVIKEAPKKNGIVAENGGLYYYVDGKLNYAGLIEVDGFFYYVRTNGKLAQSQKYWITKTNGLTYKDAPIKQATYEFDADGKMVFGNHPSMKNGIIDGFYYVDGVKTYAGLIEIDGDLYYVRTSGEIVKGRKYWITKTNGLKEEGSYEFDADGKLVNPEENAFTGIKDGYYYKDGVKTYAGLVEIDGDLYYVNSSCQIITGRKYWITKTNGLLEEKAYTFDADGKLVG